MEKCFIANLKGGDLFAKDGKEFIVFKVSELKKYCDTEVYEDFAGILGEDNIFDEEVDLTTMDGQKLYGSCICRVRPLTFDEWRMYNQYLPEEVFTDWYWLCTAWSTPDRGWKNSVAVCFAGHCVPACVISSSVIVNRI